MELQNFFSHIQPFAQTPPLPASPSPINYHLLNQELLFQHLGKRNLSQASISPLPENALVMEQHPATKKRKQPQLSTASTQTPHLSASPPVEQTASKTLQESSLLKQTVSKTEGKKRWKERKWQWILRGYDERLTDEQIVFRYFGNAIPFQKHLESIDKLLQKIPFYRTRKKNLSPSSFKLSKQNFHRLLQHLEKRNSSQTPTSALPGTATKAEQQPLPARVLKTQAVAALLPLPVPVPIDPCSRKTEFSSLPVSVNSSKRQAISHGKIPVPAALPPQEVRLVEKEVTLVPFLFSEDSTDTSPIGEVFSPLPSLFYDL